MASSRKRYRTCAAGLLEAVLARKGDAKPIAFEDGAAGSEFDRARRSGGAKTAPGLGHSVGAACLSRS